MKLAKKIISVFLVLATIFGMIGSLSACSMSANKVKVGDWFSMVIDRFGITGYNSTEPYYSNITSSNKYFDVVQAAYEWDIINAETEFELEDNLSKKLAANTLVRAVGRADIEGLSVDEITQFAADNGYVTFKYRGRTDGKRLVSEDDAITSLDAAFDIWANYDFGAPQEALAVADDVFVVGANSADDSGSSGIGGSGNGGIGIPGMNGGGAGSEDPSETTESQTGDLSSNSGNGGKLGSEVGGLVNDIAGVVGDVASDGASSATGIVNDISDVLNTAEVEQIWLEEDVVAIPEKEVEGLKEGDTYVVPGIDGRPSAAYAVEEIKYEDGYAIIHNDAEGAPFEETVEELDASGSFVPDLTQSIIYDGTGAVISTPSATNTGAFVKPTATFANYDGQGIETTSTGGKASIGFSTDGLSIKGSVSSNSVSFSISGELYANKAKGIKVKVSESYEIKDIKLNYDYKVKGFKIKSAYAKLDYTTVEKNTFGVSAGKTGVLEMDHDQGYGGSLLSKLKENAHINDAAKSKGSKTIKICYIPLAGAGNIAGLGLDVKLKISFSGEVELVVTTNNTRGVEYKDGKIRTISEESKNTEFVAKAKLEATIYLGASCTALGYTLIGIGVEVGAGISATVTVHLATSENELIEEMSFGAANCGAIDDASQGFNGITYTTEEKGSVTVKVENCIDAEIYWIAKLTVDTDCLISKLLDTELSFDLVSGKNKTIAEWHWEDGKRVPECTRNYGKADEEETTASESTTYEVPTGVIEEGSMLDLDTYFLEVAAGETCRITLVELPEGYSVADVTYSSADTKIATVDGFGTVRGVDGGATQITVKTKDGKYSASCNVYVTVEKVEFEPVKPVEL